MRIVFIHAGAESLGIEYLAAVLRERGHEAELLFDPSPFGGRLTIENRFLARMTDMSARIAARLRENPPDVVGPATYTDTYHWTDSLTRRIRADFKGKIILGGVHASLCPGEVLERSCADAVLVGEGEVALPAWLDSIASGGGAAVPGVYLKGGVAGGRFSGAPVVVNLDEIPFPAKDIFYKKVPVLEEHYMILSGRGCPYRCTYCCSDALRGVCGGAGYVRRRSVDNVVEELRPWKRRGRTRLVVFRDDVFTLSASWLREFAEKYPREVGLPFFCYTYPGALNEERADALRRAGCVFVTMGVQSADERVRREVLGRPHSNEAALRTARLVRERGIRLSIDHIVGAPDERPEHLDAAARFYNELRPDRALVFWMTYYPGTALFERARSDGTLSAADVENVIGGDIPFRNLGGMVAGDRAKRLRFTILLAFLPMLPRRLAALIAGRGLQHLIPPVFWLYNAALFVNAARIRDTMFFHTVKYALSRKRAP